MRNYFKNLLSREVYGRVARNLKLSKVKPRVFLKFDKFWGFGWPKKISRVAICILVTIFLSGYYPAFSIPPIKLSKVSAETNLQSQEIIASSFPQPVILPHPGYLSSKFSHFHPGVDIATTLGTSVHPVTAGIVEEVKVGFWGYGNHLTVSHNNGFKSLYSHLGKIFAKGGQEVTTDTILGEVGMTGFSSGPHTHLEITHNGEYIDPQLILPELPLIGQSPPPKQ